MNSYLVKNQIVGYFKVFGYKCSILNIKKYLDKFEKKMNQEIFLDYSNDKRVYRVYNRRTLCWNIATNWRIS